VGSRRPTHPRLALFDRKKASFPAGDASGQHASNDRLLAKHRGLGESPKCCRQLLATVLQQRNQGISDG
jgi:hypothetical protein